AAYSGDRPTHRSRHAGCGVAFPVQRRNRRGANQKGDRMLPFDPMTAAGAFDPLAQRGQYARQRFLTLDDLLLEQRIIFVSQVITNPLADLIIKQLLYLQYENKTADVHLYINSPGGSVSATLAIYDTMQFLEAPIHTYCMGIAASGAAILLAAG